MFVDDGHVGREECGRSGFYKFENLLCTWTCRRVGRGMDGRGGGEIIKEDAAYTSTFATMGNCEILVALLFEIGPVALIVLVACLLERLVEMDGIGMVEVGRGQVGTTAKPPCVRFPRHVGIFNLKVPVIQVDRWHVRVPGVDDDAEASCEEWDGAGWFGQTGVVRQHRLLRVRWEVTVDDGDVYTGFFKDPAVCQDAG